MIFYETGNYTVGLVDNQLTIEIIMSYDKTNFEQYNIYTLSNVLSRNKKYNITYRVIALYDDNEDNRGLYIYEKSIFNRDFDLNWMNKPLVVRLVLLGTTIHNKQECDAFIVDSELNNFIEVSKSS